MNECKVEIENTFRACRVTNDSGVVTAGIVNMNLEQLCHGEVVIRVHYSSINYKDALAVTGRGRILRRFPLNAGVDLSGVVMSSTDTRFQEGDEVLVTGCGLGESHDGGFSEVARVPAVSLAAVGDAMSEAVRRLEMYDTETKYRATVLSNQRITPEDSADEIRELVDDMMETMREAEGIGLAGATPVFVDCDPLCYNLDPTQLEAAITERTRAIVPVHLYGQPCEIDKVMAIAEKHDLKGYGSHDP